MTLEMEAAATALQSGKKMQVIYSALFLPDLY